MATTKLRCVNDFTWLKDSLKLALKDDLCMFLFLLEQHQLFHIKFTVMSILSGQFQSPCHISSTICANNVEENIFKKKQQKKI